MCFLIEAKSKECADVGHWMELEDLIYSINSSNFQKILDIINNFYKKYKENVFSLIVHVAAVRRFAYKQLADLWVSIGKTKQIFSNTYFLEYLVKRNILKKKQLEYKIRTKYTTEEFENGCVPSNSVQYYISYDLLDDFLYYLVDDSFVNKKFKMDNASLTPFSISAMTASLNCFRFLYLNYYEEIPELTVECAFIGGNEEIINLISYKTNDFAPYIFTSLRYHHDYITQWLIDNYRLEHIDLHFCISNYNMRAICYYAEMYQDMAKRELFKQEKNEKRKVRFTSFIDEKDICGKTPLMCASRIGHIQAVKCLLNRGAYLEAKDFNGQNALLIASSKGQTKVVEYLIERGANIEIADKYGNTPVKRAIGRKTKKIIKAHLKKKKPCRI